MLIKKEISLITYLKYVKENTCFDEKKSKTSVADNDQISSDSDSEEDEQYSSESNDEEEDDDTHPPPTLIINQAMPNDVLVPVEMTSRDLVSSETSIEFLNQNENIMQFYEPNYTGGTFLSSISNGFFYSLPYETSKEPSIITENENKYFVL
jgi:hypothetical protein